MWPSPWSSDRPSVPSSSPAMESPPSSTANPALFPPRYCSKLQLLSVQLVWCPYICCIEAGRLVVSERQVCSVAHKDWAPVEGQLLTQWANEVKPDNVLPEYPRPQLVRDDWLNLNGLWDYAILPLAAEVDEYEGEILVPFPVESALSGVKRPDRKSVV